MTTKTTATDRIDVARQSRVQPVKARYLAGDIDDHETLRLLVTMGASVPVAVELVNKWRKERGDD